MGQKYDIPKLRASLKWTDPFKPHIYGTPQRKQSKNLTDGEIFYWDTHSISHKNAFLCNFHYIFLLIMMWKLQKNMVSIFRSHLGCALHTRSWVFFQNFQNTAFWLLYFSACKKATAIVFIRGDREYPVVRFEYKTVSERYLVGEI